MTNDDMAYAGPGGSTSHGPLPDLPPLTAQHEDGFVGLDPPLGG
jgi:hypothetical protein